MAAAAALALQDLIIVKLAPTLDEHVQEDLDVIR
jgi:hypothetical protein